MKYIIIGVSGLIGSRLAESLTATGDHVTGVSRSVEQLSVKFPFLTEKSSWNGSDPKALAPIINGADVVVNLAGESIAGKRWSPAQKHRIIDSRRVTTLALAEAVKRTKNPPSTVIQASATGWYKPENKGRITESSAPGDHFLSEVCRIWESSAQSMKDTTRLVMVRTGVVLDKSGGALPQMLLPFRFYAGGYVSNGKQFIPWIHIQDEIKAIRFLASNSATRGVYNLTSPQPVQMKIFAGCMADVLKRPSWLPVPGFALRMIMGEMAQELLLDSYPVYPERLIDEGFQFSFPSLEPALKAILA